LQLGDDRQHRHSELIGGDYLRRAPGRRGVVGIARIAQLRSALLASGKGDAGSLRDLPPLLLGKRGVEMKHEWISIGAELCHYEGNSLGHQAGNEGHVAREAIELTSPKRKEFFGPLGVTNIRTFVDPEDPTRVAVMMDVPDMDALQAAMQSKAAADAMDFDGVVPESLVILVESKG
jgi:hypothetical protein